MDSHMDSFGFHLKRDLPVVGSCVFAALQRNDASHSPGYSRLLGGCKAMKELFVWFFGFVFWSLVGTSFSAGHSWRTSWGDLEIKQALVAELANKRVLGGIRLRTDEECYKP